jgi:hypothetical protein
VPRRCRGWVRQDKRGMRPLLFDATEGWNADKRSTGNARYHHLFERRSDQRQLDRPMATGRLRVSLQQVCRGLKSQLIWPSHCAILMPLCKPTLAVLEPRAKSCLCPLPPTRPSLLSCPAKHRSSVSPTPPRRARAPSKRLF